MPACLLEDRGIARVAGEEARSFLQGILTCNLDRIEPGRPGFGALLTPQGKILFDFILSARDEGDYWLDCPRMLAPDLARRLSIYRLRAKVTIEDISVHMGVGAIWDESQTGADLLGAETDPRNCELGFRVLGSRDSLLDNPIFERDTSVYEARRIALGVPKGGADFAYGDAFPHEANMDRLHGLDFQKGCYVGQEVVSRVEHRGLARKRVVRVRFDSAAPPPGMPVMAGGTEIGQTGSVAGNRGLAMLRLDRVEDARAAGVAIVTQEGVGLVVEPTP